MRTAGTANELQHSHVHMTTPVRYLYHVTPVQVPMLDVGNLFELCDVCSKPTHIVLCLELILLSPTQVSAQMPPVHLLDLNGSCCFPLPLLLLKKFADLWRCESQCSYAW